MSSNLKVNTILPSTGTTIGIGTVGGLINIVGNIDVNSTSGISTFNGLEISGIVTAKAGAAVTYYGDGSNLTSLPSQVTISNNADNRVITGGSGTNLNGEANLTFDGNNIILAGNDGRRFSFAGGGTSHYMKYDNTLGGIILNGYGGITFETNGTNERLRIDSAGRIGIGENNPTRDVVLKKSGSVQFSMVGATNQSVYLNFGDTDDDNIGGVYYDNGNNRMIIRANTNDAVQVKSNGNMAVNDGDLEIGTSGHGISFAATGDSAGNQGSSELFDDYEEGSWTPAFRAGNNATACPTTVSEAKYTKVGRLVVATAYFTMSSYASGTTGGDTRIVGLPYQNIGDHGGVTINYWWSLKQNINFMAGTVQGGTSEILIRATIGTATGTDNIDFDNTFGPGDSLILTATYHTS